MQFFLEEKNRTNKTLRNFFLSEQKRAKLIDQALVDLIGEIEKITLRGGKRARSLLTRMGYQLAGGESDQIVQASLFAELLHVYMLIHDDIADRDYVRYGGDTLQVVFAKKAKNKFGGDGNHFGMSVAMVAGDLTHTLAHEALFQSNFKAKLLIECERVMSLTLKEVATGWYLHMVQNQQDVAQANMQRYLDGMKLVSASYSFEAPLMIGLILAEASKQLINEVRTYAYHTGMAFQIQDDILGLFGETQTTGKPVGNDVREGKKTLLVIKAYEKANRPDRMFLKEALMSKDLDENQLCRVQQIVIHTGSLTYSQKMAENHVVKAQEILTGISNKHNQDIIDKLAGLAEFAVRRDY